MKRISPDCPEELRELAAYGPFSVISSSDPKIVDRDARPFFFQVPRDPDPRVRMRLAEAAALALNDGLRIPRPSIEAPLDPRHLSAVDHGSRGFVARVSPPASLPDAAECPAMKIPHDMQIVEGDVVTITAHVTISSAPGENRIFLAAGDKHGPTVILDREHIELVTTSIRVGDEVTHVNAPPTLEPNTGWDTGIVVAIAGDEAWITWNASGSAVWGVAGLRRTRTQEQIRDAAAPALQRALQAAE